MRTSSVLKTVFLSPIRFVWLTLISSGSFTIQLRIPVYVPKTRTEFYIEHKHLAICVWQLQTSSLYVYDKKDEKIFCMVWHNCSVWGRTVLPNWGAQKFLQFSLTSLIGPAFSLCYERRSTAHDVKFMKMYQLAFVQKIPRTSVHCLPPLPPPPPPPPPPPTNVQLTSEYVDGKCIFITAP